MIKTPWMACKSRTPMFLLFSRQEVTYRFGYTVLPWQYMVIDSKIWLRGHEDPKKHQEIHYPILGQGGNRGEGESPAFLNSSACQDCILIPRESARDLKSI